MNANDLPFFGLSNSLFGDFIVFFNSIYSTFSLPLGRWLPPWLLDSTVVKLFVLVFGESFLTFSLLDIMFTSGLVVILAITLGNWVVKIIDLFIPG